MAYLSGEQDWGQTHYFSHIKVILLGKLLSPVLLPSTHLAQNRAVYRFRDHNPVQWSYFGVIEFRGRFLQISLPRVLR